MVNRYKVTLFLRLMKIAATSRFVLSERKKNLDTLALLGLALSGAKQCVLGLTPEDYISGPDPDNKRPGNDVWVFGLKLEESEIYVKLCVVTEPLLCTCISFHVADKVLSYPLRAPKA